MHSHNLCSYGGTYIEAANKDITVHNIPSVSYLINNSNKRLEEEKEKVMKTYTTEDDQRRYLQDRLYLVESDKIKELQRKYGMRDDTFPTTGKELVDRITAGKYILDSERCNDYNFRGIRWRDPAIKTDAEGFEAAQKILISASQEARDICQLLPIADGYAALKAFEAKEFT